MRRWRQGWCFDGEGFVVIALEMRAQCGRCGGRGRKGEGEAAGV